MKRGFIPCYGPHQMTPLVPNSSLRTRGNNNLGEIKMTNRITDVSLRQVAIVTGVALIIMAIAAGFAVGFVNESLIVPEDTVATANNIKASEMLFRTGIFSWLLIFVLDILIAWGLYIFLKPVNKSLSLLSAWLRLMYTAILGIALANLVIVLLLLSGDDYLTVFETEQIYALGLLFINGFHSIWSVGLIVFGLHLFALGYLVFKSGYVPKILGILLIIAAFGYLIIDGGKLLVPNFEDYRATFELIFMIPMIIGEVGLALWLLIKGTKISNIPYEEQ